MFLKGIFKIGNFNDCNNDEILANIGEELGICSNREKFTKKLEDGLCKGCQDDFNN